MSPSFAQFTSDRAVHKFNEFLSTINTNEGYATKNRFEVLVLPPTAMAFEVQSKDISLRCIDVTLPGRNLATLTDSNIYGPTREIVNGVVYAEGISLTFIASAGLGERVFFEEWQQLAFNDSTWDLGYYDDYVGEIHIFILNKQNERKFGIKLIEAFPKTIGGTELAMETQNAIITLPITFAFHYWETLDITRIPDRATISNDLGGTRTFKINGVPVTKEEHAAALARGGRLD